MVNGEGELVTGAQAAAVWRGVYERVGNAIDDAEEKIQQANPFDEEFRQSVQHRIAVMVKSMQANLGVQHPTGRCNSG